MENWKEKYEKTNAELEKFKQDYEQFIQVAAHDLESPLRKLSTFSDRLKNKLKNVQNEDVKLYIDRINNMVEQMRSIVDSLYSLSIVNEEKLSIQPCDLDKILERVFTNFAEEIKEEKILIEKNDLPNIKGNENQLFLLFKNILDNSIKFSRKETPLLVSIRAELVTEEEKRSFGLPAEASYQKIYIRDNGIGFDQAQAENIFKPFVRLHGKSEFSGSGLGLSICKKIVEKHKGIIQAEGNKNSGACFVLILPQ